MRPRDPPRPGEGDCGAPSSRGPTAAGGPPSAILVLGLRGRLRGADSFSGKALRKVRLAAQRQSVVPPFEKPSGWLVKRGDRILLFKLE